MVATPEVQLVRLCTGYGAVPSRIPTVAPFLQALPATQHAHEVLSSNGPISWEHAARDLLICVTKPGGAAGFDARTARFVRACLALDGALESYTQRMNDLANDPDFTFWKSPNTRDKQREEAMGILAARLLQLGSYPCAPSKLKAATQRHLDLLEFVRTHDYEHFDDDEMREVYKDVFGILVNASAFFDRHDPDLSPARRLNIIVTAVAARPYRQLYDELKPRSIDLLVPPNEVRALFEGKPSPFDPESSETERAMRLIERIVLDIEERDGWEGALLATATATAEDDDALTGAETLRLRAYFERLADDS